MALVAFAYFGFNAITFELCIFGTMLSLAQSLSLISSIPSIVDVYCNCHDVIDPAGYIAISGLLLKMTTCVIMLLYTAEFSGPSDFSVSLLIDNISRGTLIVIGLMDTYVLFTNRLFDTSGYMTRHGLDNILRSGNDQINLSIFAMINV